MNPEELPVINNNSLDTTTLDITASLHSLNLLDPLSPPPRLEDSQIALPLPPSLDVNLITLTSADEYHCLLNDEQGAVSSAKKRKLQEMSNYVPAEDSKSNSSSSKRIHHNPPPATAAA